jgi:hypothetical protein
VTTLTRAQAVLALPDLVRYAPLTMRELEAALGAGAAGAVIDALMQGTVRGEHVPGKGWGYRGCDPPPPGERRPGMLRGMGEVRAAALERARQREEEKRARRGVRGTT